MDSEVKVQVVCVTYNQKDYIKDALDSFIMQKTNFKFQVLVGDDCSTDGTSEVVAEYARKYPDIIVHIRREQNLGCLKNFIDLCEQVTAKYAAFCDGDDYWTDENKLQIQFDYMEKNTDVNVCAHNVLVKMEVNDSLYEYYKRFGFNVPLEFPCSKKITVNDIIQSLPQTSSLFIRWKKMLFPSWAKEGFAGDFTVVCLQLCDKYAVVLNKPMSCYRKNKTCVTFDNGNLWEHYIRTRTDYFRFLLGIISYLNCEYNSFGVDALEKRLSIEIVNYLNSIIETDSWEQLLLIKEKYPEIYKQIKELLFEYKYNLIQVNKLGYKQASLLKKSSTLFLLKPLLQLIYIVKKVVKQISVILKKIPSFISYWLFSLVPKKKNLWVFSGFFKNNYMDNTKYLYEYIVKNHPEIDVVWLTKNKDVLKQLQQEKMPVLKMKSFKGIWTMARAQVAFSDHFKMSDYDSRFGFNACTKFINLWHGVGLKSMAPYGNKIKNTNVNGVRLSSDICTKPEDSLLTRILKKIKYVFFAPFRELFEEYLMMLCPGEQFSQYNATPWQVPSSAQFMCGYPRNVNLAHNKNKVINQFKIIYAPTYRWIADDETSMVKMFLDNIENINQILEKINGTFTLRLHPHTWRNYEENILAAISKYPRFSVSKEKDIYKELHEYSLMISDYSSIVYDFLILDRPIVFFAFDQEKYCSGDASFSMPYKENCPGDVTCTWDETLISIQKSYENPQYNKELREKISEIFTPKKYNDENNSERIVQYVKNKLNERNNNE